jgi:hypothetical protein
MDLQQDHFILSGPWHRYIQTQPIYEPQAHNEDNVPHKQPPANGFGLATPQQVMIP